MLVGRYKTAYNQNKIGRLPQNPWFWAGLLIKIYYASDININDIEEINYTRNSKKLSLPFPEMWGTIFTRKEFGKQFYKTRHVTLLFLGWIVWIISSHCVKNVPCWSTKFFPIKRTFYSGFFLSCCLLYLRCVAVTTLHEDAIFALNVQEVTKQTVLFSIKRLTYKEVSLQQKVSLPFF